MAEEDTVLFKIYYEDKSKLNKLLSKVTAITTNGIQWEEPEKTKDERGEDCVFIRSKLTPAKQAKQIIKEIKIMSNVVDCKVMQIKVVQPGFGNMNNIEVADDIPLVDPEYHDEIENYLNVLKQRINIVGNYITKACKSDIRGRLSARISEIPQVGKTCKLIGKIRYNEKDYSLQGNTTCGWYISRSNGPWNLVSETFEFTPIAEDAGCKVLCIVYFKGERHVYDASFVHIDRAYDSELCMIVKKGKHLVFPCATSTSFTDIELKKAGKKGGDDLDLRKNTLAFRRGRRILFRADLGATAYVKTIREANSCQCQVNIGGKDIVVSFRAPEECARFVLLTRAYTAYDRLKLVLSLPKLPMTPEYNEISYISPLIQGGFATMPYLWDEVPNIMPELPEVNKKAVTAVNSILSTLSDANRLDSTDYSVIAMSLIPAARASVDISLPTEEIYEKAPVVDPEEPVEEEEVDIQFDPDMLILADGSSVPYIPGQQIPPGAHLADGSTPASTGAASGPSIPSKVEMTAIKSIPELADSAPDGPFKLDKAAAEKLLSLFNKASPDGKPLPKESCYSMFDKAQVEPEIRDKVVTLIIGDSNTICDSQYIVIIQILKLIKKSVPMPKTIPAELLPILPAVSAPSIPKTQKPSMIKEAEESIDWTISKSIQKTLTLQYKKACGDKPELTSPMAMKHYKKSGVASEDILAIINLVCGKKPSAYEDKQFVVIMFMLQKISEGASVPSELPNEIKTVLGIEVTEEAEQEEEQEAPVESSSDDWEIRDALWSKIEGVFTKKMNGEAMMPPEVAMKLFKKNEVDTPIIQKVWKLVQSKPSALSLPQFTSIMYILQCVKKGQTAPDTLPASFLSRVQPATSPASLSSPKPKKAAVVSESQSMSESGEVDWTPEDSVVSKLTTVFEKKAAGESELPISAALKLFQKTGCPNADIVKICKLVVGGKPTTINCGQFVAIMFISQRVGKGAAIPSMLPPQIQRLL